MTESMRARVLGPKDGNAGMLGSMGVRFMLDGDETGGGFALVEHPMPPRALAAPLHRHAHEDEYSFVLEGRVGALLGDEVVYGEVGDLIFKPRDQWHTFWNDGDEPARILEMISPAGSSGTSRRSRPARAGPGRPSRATSQRSLHERARGRPREHPRLTQKYGLHFGPQAP